MVAMLQFNPELAKSTPAENASSYGGRPGSAYDPPTRTTSIGSRGSFYTSAGLDANGEPLQDDDDDAIPVGHHFTYIPPNPKKFYKRLLEHCLLTDLEIMLSPEVDDNEEVSLGILSDAHLDLLNECALRWRIGHPYRAVCFLDLVKQFYERQDIPLQCIPEAMEHVSKSMSDMAIGNWPAQDVRRAFLFFPSPSTSTSRSSVLITVT
jgi:hypothetical protein